MLKNKIQTGMKTFFMALLGEKQDTLMKYYDFDINTRRGEYIRL